MLLSSAFTTASPFLQMPADKPPGQEDCPSTPTAPPMDLPRLSTGGKTCFTPDGDNYL